MSVRERINAHPAVTAGIVVAALAVVVGIVLFLMRGNARSPVDGSGGKAFFTIDDGKSYFTDRLDRIPPFQTAEGKTAYRANVVRCGKGQPFVAFLEKYSEADKQRIESGLQRPGGGNLHTLRLTLGISPIVKAPGTRDSAWAQMTPQTSSQYLSLTQPRCPDGSSPERVMPD